MLTTLAPCPAPGVWYAGAHLAHWPASQTRAVLYCGQCYGLGTVRVPTPDSVAREIPPTYAARGVSVAYAAARYAEHAEPCPVSGDLTRVIHWG